MTKLMSIIVGGALGLTLAASVGVGVAVGSNNEIMEAQAASTFTWNLATNSYSSSSNSKITWSNSYAKMTSEQGGSTTKANNYIPTAQTKTRAYKNFKWTISPTANYVVTKAVFTAEKIVMLPLSKIPLGQMLLLLLMVLQLQLLQLIVLNHFMLF